MSVYFTDVGEIVASIKSDTSPIIEKKVDFDEKRIKRYDSYSDEKLKRALPSEMQQLYPHITREEAIHFLNTGEGPEKDTVNKIRRFREYFQASDPIKELLNILYGSITTYAAASEEDIRQRTATILIAYSQNDQFGDSARFAARDLGISVDCLDAEIYMPLIMKRYLQAQRDKSSVLTISGVIAMSPEEFERIAPTVAYESRTDYVAREYYGLK